MRSGMAADASKYGITGDLRFDYQWRYRSGGSDPPRKWAAFPVERRRDHSVGDEALQQAGLIERHDTGDHLVVIGHDDLLALRTLLIQ